jgi:hypothetical protein
MAVPPPITLAYVRSCALSQIGCHAEIGSRLLLKLCIDSEEAFNEADLSNLKVR